LIELQFDAQGILEMQRKLDRLDQAVSRRVDDALSREVSEMRMAAQRLAPMRTGNLASSIFSERTGECAFKMGARTPYAVFVEFGTRFTHARRFLARALESGVQRLIQRVNAAVDEAVAEAGTS